ncbi:MAG: NAD(P)H-hydrate dehydratase [Pseudomonadota bacterium]
MCDNFTAAASQVTTEALRLWPLPMPSADGDKEERGHILIIGGSSEMPGAVILAASAALRAGAGKLTIATSVNIAQLVALAVPEARVIGLPETSAGGIAAPAARTLEGVIAKVDALLIGPGMQDEPATCEFVCALLSRMDGTKVVLDACAMGVACEKGEEVHSSTDAGNFGGAKWRCAETKERKFLNRFDVQVALTPHAGEMAHLRSSAKQEIVADPSATAQAAARQWNAVVALKGATTFVATPDKQLWQHDGGNIGLAISGSGDTLAGIIAGLAARGASLEQACVWGVALHARAGQELALRTGPLGYLARDIAAEVPRLMHALGQS